MDKEFDNTNRGAIFMVYDKEGNENRPDYKGELNVNGVEYWVACWNKKSKNGKAYKSISITPKEEKKSGIEYARSVREKLSPADEVVTNFNEDEPIDLDSIPF